MMFVALWFATGSIITMQSDHVILGFDDTNYKYVPNGNLYSKLDFHNGYLVQ